MKKENSVNSRSKLPELFSFSGKDNIREEAHFGIINGQITTGVNFKDVFSISGLWAPPLASSDFLLEPLLFGQKVAAKDYVWHQYKIVRTGKLRCIETSSETILPAGLRAALSIITLRNTSSRPVCLPVSINIRGGLDYIGRWEFATPITNLMTQNSVVSGLIVKQNNCGAMVIGADIAGLIWNNTRSCWRGQIVLAPGVQKKFHLAVAMDTKLAAAMKTCRRMLTTPQKIADSAKKSFIKQVRGLYARLPALEADNERLVKMYERSILHFLLCKWQVPEFVLHPYYGTGGINGGCVGNYLWNFGEGWEIHPLYDPKAVREHIKQFLKIDLTKHFAFNPIDGKGFGPWYQINQEKIIGLIYYYVLNTGDLAFLEDKVKGRTIIKHVINHALMGDDLSKPVALYDYGELGEQHLELRRNIPYHGIMPDLNGRRYLNYMWAYALSRLAGRPVYHLPERAAALKALLKRELWNSDKKWFDFVISGKKDVRWTVQMYKLINSPVLDKEEEEGLLSHLNELEFLSRYGLHSLAKGDAAYDRNDVDNGGPGACTGFPPQIIERLYKAGHIKLAEDLFRRILWWGERMPYWGDSIVADKIDYRRDTPLQCTLDGITVAQTVIFGMFGVEVRVNGDIVINPHPPAFSPRIKLKGLKLRGMNIDISVNARKYTVIVNGRTMRSCVNTPLTIKAK